MRGPAALGGDEGNRTLDPLLAGQVLSQLSYTPVCVNVAVRRHIASASADISRCRRQHIARPQGRISLRGLPRPRSLKIEQCRTNSCLFLYKVVCTRISPYPHVLHRKEVIQPHLPIRLPCYDLTPIIEPTFGCFLLAVRTQTSGLSDFHGLTGGVYKARERIHRDMLIRDY